jgi:hypothetical protein
LRAVFVFSVCGQPSIKGFDGRKHHFSNRLFQPARTCRESFNVIQPSPMETPPEPTPPVGTKRSFFWIFFILSPGMILLLYVLSYGPVLMMVGKGRIMPNNQFVTKLYQPLIWAYDETPLHKPLGLYLHLWVPQWFDKNGN